MRQDLINDFHDSRINGHPGFGRTLQGISRLYQWPGLARDVKNYVTSCDVCQKTKPLTQAAIGLMQSLPIPEAQWIDLTMDLISPLPTTPKGHSAICVVIDRLTKMVRIFSTKATVTAIVPPYAIFFVFYDIVLATYVLRLFTVLDVCPYFLNLAGL